MSFFTRYFSHKPNPPAVQAYELQDYDATYTRLMSILKMGGFRATKKDSDFARICWTIFFWIEFANPILEAVFLIINMLVIGKQGSIENTLTVIRLMPTVVYLLLGNVMCYKIVIHRSVFENLISELRTMWPQGEVSKEEYDIISSRIKPLAVVVEGHYWSFYGLLLVYLGPPIFSYIKYAFGYDVQLGLPYEIWLPFDVYQPIYYELVLVFQIWSGFVLIWFLLAGYLSLYTFLSHLTIQFNLLSYRIRRFIRVPSDRQLIKTYPLAQLYNEECRQNNGQHTNTLYDTQLDDVLAEIVRRHQALIRLSGDVESFYSFALLQIFFANTMFICIYGFCITTIEKWTEFTFKSFLVSALTQTWAICWYGEELIQSCTGVSDAIYSCGWYQASNKVKLSLLIMLQRSQRGVCITTYGFSTVCLITFSKIINTSWSYLSILLNFYN